MKRVCFDTGSNYFSDLHGLTLEPSEARCYFKNKEFEFHAATTFDSSSRKFKDFTDHKKLFDYLLRADEIITYNGRMCDLVVLEKLVGVEAMVNLWRKPHHDLRSWRGAFGLKNAVTRFLPDIAESFDSVETDRLAKIRNLYDGKFIAGHDGDFIAEKLANTYRDAKFTFALFRRYLASGDSECTFHNMSEPIFCSLIPDS
jgi:hypothetical protein